MTDPVLKECVKQLTAITKDHEARIRKLEHYAALGLGIVAVIQFLASK
jgi:hypothetical protein